MVADEIAWIYNVRKCQVFFKGSLVMQSSVEQHTCSKKRGGAVQHTSFFYSQHPFQRLFYFIFLDFKKFQTPLPGQKTLFQHCSVFIFFSFFRLVVFSILLFFFSLLSNVLLYQAHLRFQLLLFLPERTVWSIYEGQVYLCNKTLRCLTLALRG